MTLNEMDYDCDLNKNLIKKDKNDIYEELNDIVV